MNRIKPNMCMLGDMVLLNGVPTKIESITDEGVNIEWDGNEMYGYAGEYDEIEPIPLTAEILQKNGFSIKEGESIMGLAIEDTFTMNIDDEHGQHKWSIIITDGPWCVKIKVFGMLAINLVIHFVHELQHALRLIGLAEIADNFKIN